jgi:hypothetical protein
MSDTAATRQKNLRTLEDEIRQGTARTGLVLKEILDSALYKKEGFVNWEDYCRQRWGWSGDQVRKLIRAALYRQVLPDVDAASTDGSGGWTAGMVQELTRIPDRDRAARVAARVLAEVKEEGGKLTSNRVRKAVDAELGIDRAAKAKATRERHAEEERQRLAEQDRRDHPDLNDYMFKRFREKDKFLKGMNEIPPDSKADLEERYVGLWWEHTAYCLAEIDAPARSRS